MDVLALVCNLYADGPVTLHRLRRAGLDGRVPLDLATNENLAELLSSSVAVADRFKREAQRLYERIEGEREGEGEGEGDFAQDSLGEHDALVERALERWRTWDQTDVPFGARGAPGHREAAAGAGASVVSGTLGTTGADDDGEEQQSLAAAQLAGLDGASLGRLETGGVCTLEQLMESDAAELSLELGLPLRRLMRWQLLARRSMAAAATEQAFQLPRPGPGAAAAVASLPQVVAKARPRTAKFSPACAPRSAGTDVFGHGEGPVDSLETSGPFA